MSDKATAVPTAMGRSASPAQAALEWRSRADNRAPMARHAGAARRTDSSQVASTKPPSNSSLTTRPCGRR